MSLSDLLRQCTSRYAERPAVVDAGSRLTYQDLQTRSEATASWLTASEPASSRVTTSVSAADAHDGRPRIGLAAHNSTAYVVAYLAVLHAGGVPFLVDASAGDTELRRIAADCSLDLIVHDRAWAGHDVPGLPGLTASPQTPGERRFPLHAQTEVCRFTSGTTGRPNCLEFSGRAVRAAAENWAAGTGLTADDRTVCCAGLSNGLAFNTSLLSTFLVGAQLHLSRGLPTGGRIRRMVRETRATRLVAFPALYESFVRTDTGHEDFAGVRVAISSGAPLRATTKERFTRLTGVVVANYYGVAELGPLTYSADPDAPESLGRPLPGATLEARGPDPMDAVIHARSESMATRYLNAPGVLESRVDATGTYTTGDRGFLRDGHLVLTGRSNRMINVGGRKVDPVEVTEALDSVPGVEQAVVLEVRDRHGETVVGAVVVLRDGLASAELRVRAGELLAAHKVPSLIRVVDAIPTTVIGKPAFTELRALFPAPDAPGA